MKKTIWKYPIVNPPADSHVSIDMPIGAKVLSVQRQNEQIVLWCEVEPEAPKQERQFRVYGTGWDMPDDPGKFIGSVQCGWLVFHIYDNNPPEGVFA